MRRSYLSAGTATTHTERQTLTHTETHSTVSVERARVSDGCVSFGLYLLHLLACFVVVFFCSLTLRILFVCFYFILDVFSAFILFFCFLVEWVAVAVVAGWKNFTGNSILGSFLLICCRTVIMIVVVGIMFLLFNFFWFVVVGFYEFLHIWLLFDTRQSILLISLLCFSAVKEPSQQFGGYCSLRGRRGEWGKLCVYLTHLRKKLHAYWPSQFEANNLSSTHDGCTHTRTHTHNKKHTRRQAGTGRQAGEGKAEMTMTKKTKKAIPKRSQRPRRRRGACCARLERSAHTKDPHASRSQPKPPDGVEDKRWRWRWLRLRTSASQQLRFCAQRTTKQNWLLLRREGNTHTDRRTRRELQHVRMRSRSTALSASTAAATATLVRASRITVSIKASSQNGENNKC